MGIDFLDCVIRLEKNFTLPRRALRPEKLGAPRNSKGTLTDDVTGAQMLKWVEVTLVDCGREVPEDCWLRVQACIAATVMVPPEQVSLTSRLIKDLGFT